jgi:N-acetylmuramoyl-L-alanine amidase
LILRKSTRKTARKTARNSSPSGVLGLSVNLVRLALLGCWLFPWTLNAALTTTTLGGVPHYDLATVGVNLGMKAVWTKTQQKIELRSKWTTLKFEVDARYCELNNRKIYMGRPLSLYKKRPYITQKDYLLTIRPILAPQTLEKKQILRRIVLDAGHGGRDVGAQNTDRKLREKDLALDVALRLRQKLQADGFQVFLTRKSDSYIPLDQRAEFANRMNADLFISIHFNSVRKPSVLGLETYLLPQPWTSSSSRLSLQEMDKQSYPGNSNDGWNSLVGFFVHKTLVEKMVVVDRGLKRSRFKVLKNLKCPGMLVELGFISHPETARRLETTQYRDQLASALAQGIQLYRKTQKRLGGRA